MRHPIPSFFLKYPSSFVVWLVNQLITQKIINYPAFKRYITVKNINLICLVGATFLILYDIKLADDNLDGNTWSELMRIYGQQQVVLPWLCGVLIGHLFHLNDIPPKGKLNSVEAYNFIFWLTVLMVGIGGGAYFWKIDFPEIIMTIVALVGCAAGYLIWPIERKEDKWTW